MKNPRYFSLFLALNALLWVAGASADSVRFHMQAASTGSYAHPHDIVLSPDGKHLYVADNGNHRIAVLDSDTLEEVGSFGKGDVREPHDVVFDREGRLLVADTGNSRIAIFEISGTGGKLAGELRGGIRRPEGVAVHGDGRVYATGAASNNLIVYRDGEVVGEAEGFSAPHDVEFAPDGSVWVADAGNDRMVHMDDTLKVVEILTGAEYEFDGPRYMDFDLEGHMYVADKNSNQIKVITPDGRMLHVLGEKRQGKGEGLFNRPEGVEISGDNIWFADTYNDRIVRYRFNLE